MKSSIKRMIAAAALLAAALCAAPTGAQDGGGPARREGRQFYNLGELTPIEGLDVEARGSEVVGVSALQKDGSWLPLIRQSAPACGASCPEGQTLSCWEDERQLVSACLCGATILRYGSRGFKTLLQPARG